MWRSCASFGSPDDRFNLKVVHKVLSGNLPGAFSQMLSKRLESRPPVLEFAKCRSNHLTGGRVSAALDLASNEVLPVAAQAE